MTVKAGFAKLVSRFLSGRGAFQPYLQRVVSVKITPKLRQIICPHPQLAIYEAETS